MAKPADIFVDIKAHIDAGSFIRENSLNKHDIRDFTFEDVDLRHCREVLDLGCSYGFFVRGLAGRLHPEAHVLGIDLWRDCEEYFVKACLESGYTGEFCLSDKVFCKRYPEKTFDLIFCSYALYFFPEAIQEIARVLKPEGHFVTVTHTVPHMHELVNTIKKMLMKHFGRPVQTLPMETLFESFSDVNGHRKLSLWFKEIREKRYANALQVNEDSLPDLIHYLSFKKPLLFPEECRVDDQFIMSVAADHFRELLSHKQSLIISKNDTVYICQCPQPQDEQGK